MEVGSLSLSLLCSSLRCVSFISTSVLSEGFSFSLFLVYRVDLGVREHIKGAIKRKFNWGIFKIKDNKD